MTKLSEKIIELRKSGLSFNKISNILNCSKSIISYHISVGQKNKNLNRNQKFRQQNVLFKKIENFFNRREIRKRLKVQSSPKKLFKAKFESFFKERTNMKKYVKPTFTMKDVTNKFGENPKCYLTGKNIDYNDSSSYSFDHIQPVSKGGQNTIENLGLTTRQANQAKSDMTVDELIELSKSILINFGYTVTKINS